MRKGTAAVWLSLKPTCTLTDVRTAQHSDLIITFFSKSDLYPDWLKSLLMNVQILISSVSFLLLHYFYSSDNYWCIKFQITHGLCCICRRLRFFWGGFSHRDLDPIRAAVNNDKLLIVCQTTSLTDRRQTDMWRLVLVVLLVWTWTSSALVR